MDSLAADKLANEFDYIERIDRLITIAENRRNAFLRVRSSGGGPRHRLAPTTTLAQRPALN